MKFEVRKPTEDPGPDILTAIWEDTLPDLDARRIDWAYRRHPHGRPRVLLLDDTETGQAFGSVVVVPRWIHHRGTPLRGGVPGDFAIKRDYRTLGPALQLQRAVRESDAFDVLVAFPNRDAVGVQRRVGYEDWGYLTVYRKMFHSGPVLERRYNRHLAAIASLFVDFGNRIMSFWIGRSSLSRYAVVHSLDQGFAALWERVQGRLDFAGRRDMDYLVWRFQEHPYKTYEFFGLKENGTGRVIGYLVYYLEENIAYIEDFLVEEPQVDLGRLVDAFSAHCMRSRLHAMSLLMLECERYAHLFRKLGFSSERTPDKVLFSRQEGVPVEPDDVFITMGDCDF